MTEFSQKLDLFREADRRLVAYPRHVQGLADSISGFLISGRWGDPQAKDVLLRPDHPESLAESARFFATSGVQQVNDILDRYRAALKEGNIAGALSVIRGFGGLARSWERYLNPVYTASDILPPPAHYLFDLYETSVVLFPVAEGPEEREFAEMLEKKGNPWKGSLI